MAGELDGNRQASSTLNGHPETLRRLPPEEAYAAAVALEDAREAHRAKEAARARALEEPTILEGEVIGWRWWKYDEATGLLKSPFMDTIWPADEPIFTGDLSPNNGYPGIYAFKTRRQADQYKSIYIVGSVKMWGAVIEHEHGYKSEFAQINSIDSATRWAVEEEVEIMLPIRAWLWRRRLQKRYGLR